MLNIRDQTPRPGAVLGETPYQTAVKLMIQSSWWPPNKQAFLTSNHI